MHKLDPAQWPDEEDVLARVRDGAAADFSGRAPADAPWTGGRIRAELLRALYFGLPLDDPANVDAQGGRLPPAPVPLTRRGVRLKGVTIVGALDLEDAVGPAGEALPPLLLDSCLLAHPVNLRTARFRRIALDRCRVTHVEAAGLQVDGPASFFGLASAEEVDGIGLPRTGKRLAAQRKREGGPVMAWAPGPEAGRCILNLAGADIAGDLNLNFARLRAADPEHGGPDVALDLTDARIGSDLVARRLFAHGGVQLTGARIEAQLSLNGAFLSGGGGAALTGQSLHVGGGAYLRNQVLADQQGQPVAYPFVAHGPVGFDSATISGDFDLSGAGLYGMGGTALLMRNALVRGDATLGVSDDEAFVAYGRVNLSGSVFEGALSFAGAQFPYEDEQPGNLLCQNIIVHKQLFIGDGIWTHPATGETRAIAFDCQGQADFNSSEMKDWLRVPATRAEGGGRSPTIFWLNHASAQVLDDDGGRGWGPNARLVLDGFRYERLRDTDFATVAGERRAWLMRQFQPAQRWWSRLPGWLVPRQLAGNSAAYRPQPFEQAIAVLRRSGAQAAARDLESCKLSTEMWVSLMRPLPPAGGLRGWLGRLGEMLWRPLNFAISWLYRLTFDFGLSARRGLLTFTALILAGGLTVRALNTPDQSPPVMVLSTTPVQTLLVPDPPPATSGWGVKPAAPVQGTSAVVAEIACANQINPWLYAADVFIPLLDLKQEDQCGVNDSANGWRVAKALYATLGWIVTSLLILTITGTLRRKGDTE